MPQVTVYIRNDDLPKWKALEKKSQWIHERLLDYQDHEELKPVIERITKQPAIRDAEEVLETVEEPRIESIADYGEVWGSLNSGDMVFSEGDQWIFDKDTMEPLEEITPAQVKWLKKRGQVK